MERHPSTIVEVAPESTGARCGVQPGDRLLTINGLPPRDVIDVQILAGEPELEFVVERQGQKRRYTVQRHYGEPLGLAFAGDLFTDRIRVCRNHCLFCFVSQMRPGLRRSLYLRDDDYRLSFLYGNYITLTNLREEDWERIAEQYLSPLFISVHATEPEVRAELLGNPEAGHIMAQLTRLAEAGIEMHTQAVLVPGINDGPHLDRTIEDLSTLYPAVRDLSVVPVGLTRWHAPEIRPFRDDEMRTVLDQCLAWQETLRQRLGVRFVYPSDEWYLRAGRAAPPITAYDALLPAMIENGVGMVRRFLDGQEALQQALVGLGRRQIWVTGTLFARTLSTVAATLSHHAGLTINLVAVPNRFFGESVTVAGLLTVGDIIAALAQQPPADAIIIPGEVFRGPEGQSLDDQTPDAIHAATGCRVYVVNQDSLSNPDASWTVDPW